MDRRRYLTEKLRDFELSKSSSKSDTITHFRTAISIANQRLDFITSSPELMERLKTYFSEYQVQSNSPSGSEIFIEPLSAPAELPDLWENEDSDFDIKGDMVIHRDFAALMLKNQTNPTVIAFVSSELDDAFHNLLRWHIPPLLLKNNAFLMHSAGLIHDGSGYIFFGQSGAGKSTCSKLIQASDPRVQLIGDDAVIIEMKADGPVLHSAPLGCGYTRLAPPKLSVPLAGIFSLRQSLKNSVDALSPSEGLASLLSSAMVTSWDENIEERFELAKLFTTSKPGIKALQFTKEFNFKESIL